MRFVMIFLNLVFLLHTKKVSTFDFVDELDTSRSAMLNVSSKAEADGSRTGSRERNHNKRNEAFYEVERAMVDANLLSRFPSTANVKKYVKLAIDNGNVMFARRVLGLGMHAAGRSATSKRSKRDTGPVNPIQEFLNEVSTGLGPGRSNSLFATKGDVTLMFVVDITGSMKKEIQAAKDIVTAISRYVRKHPVDYILSSFGDPLSQGSVIYRKEGEVSKFIKDVSQLQADHGGDCAELAFNGMLNAFTFDSPPKPGSPMYVFADAPPKDASDDLVEILTKSAKERSSTINVFAWKECEDDGYSYEDFKKLAESTSGQFFELHANELPSLSQSIIKTLAGSTTLGLENSQIVRKRSAVKIILIPIDETISVLVVTITVTESTRGVRLFSPEGKLWSQNKITLEKVVMYEIDFDKGWPRSRGIWKLEIPSSVGNYTYSAKVQTAENVDFLYFYSKVVRGKMVPVSHPLAGEQANLNIVVSRVEALQTASLRIDVIDLTSRVLQTIRNLVNNGKSGERFFAKFEPPSDRPYKLKLRGLTKGGYRFQRISQNVDEARPLLLKEFYTARYHTIPRGGTTTVMMYLYNTSKKRQCFKITLRDTLKYKLTVPGHQSDCVSAKAKKFIRISVRATGRGKAGQAENVIVTALTLDKKIKTSEIVSLLVV